MHYICMMTQPAPLIETAETEADRQRRIAWEAERIAEARAELDAGLYATSAEVKAWIDSIGTDHELPVPYPRHPRG
jgi:predicted transcriptional regulator